VIKPPYAEGRQRTPAPPTRSPLARAPEPLTGAPHARATLRATVVQSLQTSAGNRAVSAMVTGRDLAVQRDDEPGAGSGAPLAERYAAALTVGDQTGNYRTAAELLNGFSRADVLSRLAVLTEQQVAYLHIGALENPAVGPGSQVAELTAPGTPRASVPERASSTGPAGAGAGGTPVGEAAIGADAAIAAMSGIDRLAEAFRRSDINAAVRAQVLAAMTPEALAAAVVGFAVGFVASQLTPVGWAADVALAFTALFIGTALFRAANHLIGFAAARNATTSREIDVAAGEFAAAVAEIEIDALLFLLTRTMGGGSAGAGPASAGSGPVMLATTGGGRLVVIAAETVPVAVSGQVGAIAGAGALAMAGTPRDPDYWEDKYGDDPLNERPRRERISDGNKAELEDSGWLRGRLPDEERRREFMEWLQRRHEQGEAHIHLRPGSREAEQAVGEFELENP
jgi:hypothetical protein